MKQLILGILLCLGCQADIALATSYAVARGATPVLNTAAFRSIFGGADGTTLKTDRCGQVRELEFIALPGTVFRITATASDRNNTIYRVATDEYLQPAGSALYVDSRFVTVRATQPPPRIRTLPPQTAIIAALKASIGAPYVWGGDVQAGIGELVGQFYGGSVPSRDKGRLTLAGLDCSGLLYQATGGGTPRNTSQLISYGKAVPVAGRSAKEIAGLLKPLDLIVWYGHVIVVLDRDTVIESRLVCGMKANAGVVTTSLQRRLAEIMRTRRPVDQWPAAAKQRDAFVVRRWYRL
ncbi:MAG: peptidoglycan endopeptidase [Geobacteraceae bacterium]|nr:peptidoglycan endopeptidase [Geobacteraceae bacterium]